MRETAFSFGQDKVQMQGDGNDARGQSSVDNSMKKVLVWIPERQGDAQEEKLLIEAADEETVAGIVYCGRLSRQTRMLLCDYLVWEESKNQENLFCNQSVDGEFLCKAMLPLVMIIGKRNEVVGFTAALREKFLLERYACVCVSDILMCYLYGMYAVESGKFGYRELAGIWKGCHPDFILCCSEHWMRGIERSRYFVIDVSGICESQGVRADLNLSMREPDYAIELTKNEIMGFTWPD